MTRADTAYDDWETRIGRISGKLHDTADVDLPAPRGLRAASGRGQVTLDWDAVDGAIGYVLFRGPAQEGPFTPVDHRGGDVKAVPRPPYTDTTRRPGEPAWYAVAACPDVHTHGRLSAAVAGTPAVAGAANVMIAVDTRDDAGPLPRPWRPMIGSEHLSHMLSRDMTGGRPIGPELREALRIVHDRLGVHAVRAHGILCDDLGVYREVDGQPVHDFTGVDRVYDLLLDIGLRPVVELSFMPQDLAADPTSTVFTYGGTISPPKDWGRWADLIRAFVAHVVDRYGLDEVRNHWAFEVWNEANLEVFWRGTPEEYLRLYDVTTAAVRDVDDGLLVGGPGSAAVGWVDGLLNHIDHSGAPLDFIATHTYGSPPLDLRPALTRHGRDEARIWWTEWGVTPTHFHPVSDSALAAAFLARGMRSAAGRADALAYWVASDHFEELGRPPSLLHGGFGLLTVGNLPKPRFHSLSMLERLGDRELEVSLTGDGAGGMVEAWASHDSVTGRVAIAVWNGTLDQSKAGGAVLLDRDVVLRIEGLEAGAYMVHHERVDEQRSNVATAWEEIRQGADWPDDAQWAALERRARLEQVHAPHRVAPTGGAVELSFALPMPAVSLVELVP